MSKRTKYPELKIKIKSLAMEAAAIKKEERKHTGDQRAKLYLHRINVVRYECRMASIAYGFLRGREYCQMESKIYSYPSWKKVENNIYRFTSEDAATVGPRFAAWKARILPKNVEHMFGRLPVQISVGPVVESAPVVAVETPVAPAKGFITKILGALSA